MDTWTSYIPSGIACTVMEESVDTITKSSEVDMYGYGL